MRETTLTCDRCSAVADPDASWWQLAFAREVVVDDMTEYISETWDLCVDCYQEVAPSVIYAVQPPDEDE